MNNPWIDFLKERCETNQILREEQDIIDEFNEKQTEDYRIHKDIMPAPFMGDIENAKIVILTLNPAFNIEEQKSGFYNIFEENWINELQRIRTIPKLPLFCLEERYQSYSPYWKKKLAPIIEELEQLNKNKPQEYKEPVIFSDQPAVEIVANNICKIQFFPYHSKKHKPLYKKLLKKYRFGDSLPSQKYNFELVNQAIERNAIIILSRAKKLWFEAIPNLEKYPNLHFTNSYGNIILSKKNLPTGFNIIIDELKKDLERYLPEDELRKDPKKHLQMDDFISYSSNNSMIPTFLTDPNKTEIYNEANDLQNVWHELGHVVGFLIVKYHFQSIGEISKVQLTIIDDQSGSITLKNSQFIPLNGSYYISGTYTYTGKDITRFKNLDRNLLLSYSIWILSGCVFEMHYCTKTPKEVDFKECIEKKEMTNRIDITGSAGDDWSKLISFIKLKGWEEEIFFNFLIDLFHLYKKYKIFDCYQPIVIQYYEKYRGVIIDKELELKKIEEEVYNILKKKKEFLSELEGLVSKLSSKLSS